MSGIVVDGEQVEVPGLRSVSWLDDPGLRLKLPEDGQNRPPGTWIRAVTLHTTRGIPGGKDLRTQTLKPGLGPSTHIARDTNAWWSTNGTAGGAHLIVDYDGGVFCTADLVREIAYHAGTVNFITVGIEIAQGPDASLYDGQLDAVVLLVDYLTARLGIQRQFHAPYAGVPCARIAQGARDVVGVYGHRDQTANRGRGDPGDLVFGKLRLAGYEAFDFSKGEDKAVWSARQQELKAHGAALTADGVPGPETLRALKASGYANGVWVARASDTPPDTVRS